MDEKNKNSALNSKLSYSAQVSMPYAMLYGKGGQFDGNKYTDLFRFWIYYFIIPSCTVIS
jgi:hypothetical protein